jgi:hypothetical protein
VCEISFLVPFNRRARDLPSDVGQSALVFGHRASNCNASSDNATQCFATLMGGGDNVRFPPTLSQEKI